MSTESQVFLNLVFLDDLDEVWPQFLLHHYTTIQQRDYIQKIKEESSEKGTAVVQIDFAENYDFISQNEIQSAHWGHEQATIFTIYIKMGSGHRNLAVISDYMHHTTEFVHFAQSKSLRSSFEVFLTSPTRFHHTIHKI